MNLIERKREEHRSRILQRIGSVLVCMSVLLAVAFPPQEAKAAFVADDMAVAAVASAFLASCGMTFRASGMDSNGVKEQVGRLIDQYISSMDETHYSNRIDWLFGDGSESFAENWKDGCLIIKAEMANKLVDLGWWVKEDFFDDPETISSPIYYESFLTITDANGNTYPVSQTAEDGFPIFAYGYANKVIKFNDNDYIDFRSGIQYFYDLDGGFIRGISMCEGDYYFFYSIKEGVLSVGIFEASNKKAINKHDYNLDRIQNDITNTLFQIDKGNISIPDAIPDSQEVAISTGAASGVSLDEALQQVLDAIAAGELSASKEIAEAGTATGEGEVVTPVEESMPVIDELGLPELGATLTTRFPFSIPWDVTRAIRLLAAPPKTPYFEVDFFEPVRYRFGGGLGNTTVVLDFSEYEIIGQVSRWASTIGFCLLLASGTKKLIWTA